MLRLSFLVVAAVIVAAVVMTASQTVSAQREFIKQRHRGGALWRDVLAQEAAFHADRNMPPPNTTANWWEHKMFPEPYPHNNPVFKQRYFIDLAAWAGKPLTERKRAIIYIPGEGPCTSSMTGYAREWAYQYGFGIFSLENRYYGESMPAPLTDKATLMRGLNVDLALWDLSEFMKYVDSTVAGGPFEWITVGGSYSGALSAWMRQTYPNQVKAAWSSSGVVHPVFDFHEYDGHISQMLSDKCYKAIKDAYAEFDRWYDDPSTRQRVYDMMKVPSYFTKRDMAFALADQGAGMVQYGRRSMMCNFLLPEVTDAPLQRYTQMAFHFFGQQAFSNCGYSTECMSNSKYSAQWAGADYSWFWQCCSELAWWQVGTPFSLRSEIVSTEYQIDQCRATFTPDTLSDTFTFNQKRGGVNVTGTDMVVAAQGADDPWSTVGVRVSPRANYPVYIAQCADCGHCGDLYSPTATDPVDLKAQRQFINNTLRGWLGL